MADNNQDRDMDKDFGWVEGNDLNDPGVVGRAGGRATAEDTGDLGVGNMQDDSGSDNMGINSDDMDDIDVI